MVQTNDMALQIIRIREHTKDYTSDDEFIAQWTGLSATDVALRTQQQKAFVKLVRQVAKDLKGMRILDVGSGGTWNSVHVLKTLLVSM